MNSNRGQYGGEGYIMSFLALTISGTFFFLIKVDSFVESKLKKRVATFAAVCALGLLINFYLALYRIKTPWY